jgi:hypothetical protein
VPGPQVEWVKRLIEEAETGQCTATPADMVLMFAGKPLENESTLGDLRIFTESTLHYVRRQPVQPPASADA